MPKTFKWTVEFTVSEHWVEDGFDITNDRALDMLSRALPYANIGNELSAKVIQAPTKTSIRKAQGFK